VARLTGVSVNDSAPVDECRGPKQSSSIKRCSNQPTRGASLRPTEAYLDVAQDVKVTAGVAQSNGSLLASAHSLPGDSY